MRTACRTATTLSVLMLVASCRGLLKKGEDAGGADASVGVSDTASAAAPTPVPTTTALATNEGDVARFPDETAFPNEHAVLLRSSNVREAPPAGPVVAGLSKGASVTKISFRAGFFLIVFDNPKSPGTSGTREMGWVHRDAFSAVREDAGPLVCRASEGEIALFGDTPFCGKPCAGDTDCPAQQACKGQANKLLPNGKAGDGVTVCTAFRGGTAPTRAGDAGHPTVDDAGAAQADATARVRTTDQD
jgi:hypothetical protein